MILELSSYIDGDLDIETMEQLEFHLRGCEDCRMVVDQTKRTLQIFCGEEAVELPAGVRSRLHDALRRKISVKQS